jgi:hypothetical protein
VVDLSGTCLGAIVAERWRQLGEAQARMPLETLKHAAQARSERRDFAAALSSRFWAISRRRIEAV